ncbi:unnamed protein product, partial [Effrenium voratum]
AQPVLIQPVGKTLCFGLLQGHFPGMPQLLVFGSSVCTGSGATCAEKGWAHMLAQEAAAQGFSYENRGVGGTTVGYWNMALSSVPEELLQALKAADVVVLSLSLGNEGLAMAQPHEALALEKRYAAGLRDLTRRLRKLRPRARLVLGGPYPNNGYELHHLQVLERIREQMSSWEEVDHVIDFLQPCIHDGKGRWLPETWEDDGHPNDQGHRLMFECLDVNAVLGMN